MKDSFGFGSFSPRKKEKTGYMIVAALIGCIFILGPCIYRATGDEVTITVSERERVHNRSGEGARYLVWTEEGEVFQVSDSISYLTFRASDRYGKLKSGRRYLVKVAGWRIGCTSSYRNIVEIVKELPSDGG